MYSAKVLKAIKWLLFAIIVGTPLFYWKWSLYPYIVPKTALFQALVELVFALWLALAISDRRYRPRMTPLAWAVAAYLAILVATAFTGVDPWRSLFSDLERGFGIVVYLHLAALALVISSLAREILWKKIWYASFGTSLVTVAIAAIQLASPNLLLANDSAAGRPGATFGNPTFLAGYLLFNIFVAGYFLFSDKTANPRERTFVSITIAAGIFGVFITETRGDIFGLFAGIVVLIALLAFRPPVLAAQSRNVFGRRNFYLLILAILVILAGGVWFTRSNPVWDHVPGIDRLKDLTLSGETSDIGARLMATEAAWQGFLARPVTGWGFENFNVVFNTYYNPKVLEYGYAESNFDKPHDIALEMLDAGGILLLLAYLAVLAGGIYEAWKVSQRSVSSSAGGNRLLGQFAAAAVVAYFVRSLVIFDTIGPALMLYLLIGWIDGEYRAAMPGAVSATMVATGNKKTDRPGKINGGVFGGALVAAVILVYALNGTAFAAGTLAWTGHQDIQLANDPADGVAAFNADITTWNVYQWDFVRDEANTVAEAYFYDPTTIPTSTVTQAITAMVQVAADHPNDAYNHYFLTDIYNLAYAIDPQQYGPAAEAQAAIALKLSPNRQEIYYYLAKTKSLEGDNADALALAKQALELDPNVADSHFYYGMLAFATGDNATGYTEVETAIKMGRQWVDYYEPEIAGDYIADSGHIPDAIPIYQAALALKPGDPTTELKLGAAYYLTGNDTLAKQYLTEAVAQFDFETSPAYAQYEPIFQALGIQQNQ
jgi:O-antigen ligase/Flp pilus assembly protein TadD